MSVKLLLIRQRARNKFPEQARPTDTACEVMITNICLEVMVSLGGCTDQASTQQPFARRQPLADPHARLADYRANMDLLPQYPALLEMHS